MLLHRAHPRHVTLYNSRRSEWGRIDSCWESIRLIVCTVDGCDGACASTETPTPCGWCPQNTRRNIENDDGLGMGGSRPLAWPESVILILYICLIRCFSQLISCQVSFAQ